MPKLARPKNEKDKKIFHGYPFSPDKYWFKKMNVHILIKKRSRKKSIKFVYYLGLIIFVY